MDQDNAPDATPEEVPQQEAPQPQAGGFPPDGEIDERSQSALNRMFAELRTELRSAKSERDQLRDLLAQAQPRTPEPEIYDPQVRAVYDGLRRVETKFEETMRAMQEREEAKRQAEAQGGELYEAYETLMEQAKTRGLPTVDPQRFFRKMEQLGLQASDTGWDEACQMVYTYMTGNPFRGGQLMSAPPPQSTPRSGPRAQVTVPVGMPNQPSPPSEFGPRRPDETPEAYLERLEKLRKEYSVNFGMLPEGIKFVS